MSALVREPHPVAAPVSLAPFRATWLSPDRVGDPASARLLARPHRAVPERIRRWRKQGHLRQDDRPAFYVHEFTSHGLTARALVALLDVTRTVDADAPAPGTAGVLPHEEVAHRQVTDLAERMDTMNLNPAPILLMHDATPGYRAVMAEACAEAPRHQFVDRAGQQHRIWRISAEDQQRAIGHEVAHDRLVVADGHHRLAAYQRLALRHAASGELDDPPRPPWRDALVMLVDQGTTPLFLGAIHRVVRGVGMRAMLDAVRRAEAGRVTTVDPTRAAHALAPRSIVFSDGHEAAVLALDEHDPRAAIEALHESVLPLLRKRPENLEYHHSADDALHRAARGPGTTRRTAILLPALSYERLVHVLDDGRRLPEKATSFQPKPSLGTVMRTW